MNVSLTPQLRPTTEYRACVDPLHRNVWPVRVGDDETPIGYLTEHITVTFDVPQPPEVRWSWKFDDAEASRLAIDGDLRESRGRYRTWRTALDAFVTLHQLAVALRFEEARETAERARKGR